MNRPALKLISRTLFSVEEGEFWSQEEELSHSLHFSISLPDSFTPGLARFFIQKYSSRGEVVLDPFCGRGTTALEAVLNERIAYASDINPLFARVTRAKLEPADLVEVAIFLQSVNLSRPISLEGFAEYFEPFFDADTYREILNLKSAISSSKTSTSQFVEMIAMSLLHGHTAGYFSAYSMPQISLTPVNQRLLNDKRGNLPEYRSISSRILRKTGAALRDGDVDRIRDRSILNKVYVADVRNLTFLPSATVDLIVTSAPKPYAYNFVNDLWLKGWFTGISKNERRRLSEISFQSQSLSDWIDFMNETLFELARVVKYGGRVALELKEVTENDRVIGLDKILFDIVESQLSTFWENESLFVNKTDGTQLSTRNRQGEDSTRTSRVLVLRRR
ncbi:MAG: DNA methyltransferase [bacterium]|nr:DNA methyltransferase [bacterium]